MGVLIFAGQPDTIPTASCGNRSGIGSHGHDVILGFEQTLRSCLAEIDIIDVSMRWVIELSMCSAHSRCPGSQALP